MSPKLSTRSAGSPSITLTLQEQVAIRRREGSDVISLAAGAPDLAPPRPVQAWLREPTGLVDNNYTDVRGLPSLRSTLGEFLLRSGWAGDSATQLLISNGAKQALFCAMAATVDQGSEILVLSPYWPSYISMASLLGAAVRPIHVHAATTPDVLLADLERCRSSRTAALVFSTPSNPTGQVLPSDTLAAVIGWAAERDLFVVADETYGHLHLDGPFRAPTVLSLPNTGHVIQIGSASKTFSLMGARVGWAAASPALIGRMAAVQSHLTSNVSNQAQAMADAALHTTDEELREREAVYTRRRDLLMAGIGELSWLQADLPGGGLFIWCELPAGLDGGRIARRLLDEKGIAVVPGADFGRTAALRLSFATAEEQIAKAVDRLGDFQPGDFRSGVRMQSRE